MDRIIGIDYGRKRVGVAVSDPLGIFASALDTVQSAKIMDYLKKYAENENVIRLLSVIRSIWTVRHPRPPRM